MMHVHLSKCESTQKAVFELLQQGETQVLVSCEEQTAGIGRRERSWFSAQQALAMSFSLRPAQPWTLTSLELGVLTREFLKRKLGAQAFLKWPNDLYTKDKKKCGGILIQGHKGSMVAGIGVNLFHPSAEIPSELRVKMGSLLPTRRELSLKELNRELYDYVAANRLEAQVIRERWAEGCMHIGRKVWAEEDGKTIEGDFLGIGDAGQALLKVGSEVAQLYNATIVFNR